MRNATDLLFLSALIIAFGLPTEAQNSFGTGSTFGGGITRGGSFGGGAPFANGSVQMYNPGVMNNPALNPYYGNGFGYNPTGYGLGYNPYGYAPIYQAPSLVPGLPGYFRLGPLNGQYWRSPSGYYYPWGVPTAGVGVPAQQTYYINQGQTQAQNPPLYAMLNDMRKFLDEMRTNGRLTEADYVHLFHRVQDLQGKYDHLMAVSGGLDSSDEDSIRRDAGLLGSEISQRVKPLAQATGEPATGSGQPAGRAGTTSTSTNKSGWVEDH